jgi:SAM-dependent methyltransferase
MNDTNTKQSFSDKWNNNKDLAFENTLKKGSEIQNWILNRNGWKNLNELRAFLENKDRILDAGCGNGRVTKLLRDNSNKKTKIVGIDLVAHKVAQDNLKNDENVYFYEKDLLADLSDMGKFDFIYSQEVLHHTKNPQQAFNNLVELLNKNGVISIYVYKKKAPVREYTDDYIRDIIKDYDYDKAMEVSDDITKLGEVLSKLNVNIDIPELKELGIKQGNYSIQHFLYHFFMKCYWNDDLSFSENSAINYDWYHPQDCSRHTVQEIEEWFTKNSLDILHIHEDFYGITISGKSR